MAQCNVGWAGNGNVCGPDTDIDGYPDQALPCMDNNKHCKQVLGQAGGWGQVVGSHRLGQARTHGSYPTPPTL